jgi:phosphonopyruvate decarboxylase
MKCDQLWQLLKRNDISFFTGVPDSTFKSWMSFLNDMNGKGLDNIIASNECEAIAIASGYHLSTGKIGVAYMQNSGFGKTINPITSLADPDVYSIPMLLLIGWRGEPGKKDEPQHKKMGRVLITLLKSLEIPFEIISDDFHISEGIITNAIKYIKKNHTPFALIVKKGNFENYKPIKIQKDLSKLSREGAISRILELLTGNEIIISTTGKTSRELFELRIKNGEIPRDFYTVGSMGCCSSIGLGVALKSKSKIIILDGDGAAIMQMGSLATIGFYQPQNFYHIIFDNNAYDSTGGQPTISNKVDFEKIALGVKYNYVETVDSINNLNEKFTNFYQSKGPSMLIIKVKKGSRKDLGRPTTTPIENKTLFMKKIQNSNTE